MVGRLGTTREVGFLVLDTGEVYRGLWRGGRERAGEVVFNTGHAGYEEMATDPSYFSQILVMTAPMQGNYGSSREDWESRRPWIHGFIALQIQESETNSSWLSLLREHEIPVLTDFDTRHLVLRLRDQGTVWGALVPGANESDARLRAQQLIHEARRGPKDWVYEVSRRQMETLTGGAQQGPRIALIDYGTKQNIVRELVKRSSVLSIWPSRTPTKEVRDWNPDGILLSNGPGDPSDVQMAVPVIQDWLGWRPIFGICMGHQLLALALGAKTYKIKFGHRGGNHPVQDLRTGEIFVTSQNHGYAVDESTLPEGLEVTYRNLNDQTVEGIRHIQKKCFSVQFHPESHPGPNDARGLFNEFFTQL